MSEVEQWLSYLHHSAQWELRCRAKLSRTSLSRSPCIESSPETGKTETNINYIMDIMGFNDFLSTLSYTSHWKYLDSLTLQLQLQGFHKTKVHDPYIANIFPGLAISRWILHLGLVFMQETTLPYMSCSSFGGTSHYLLTNSVSYCSICYRIYRYRYNWIEHCQTHQNIL